MADKKSAQAKRPRAQKGLPTRRSGLPRLSRAFAQPSRITLPSGYAELLEDLKGRIRQAQVRAAWAVNRELIALYWHIGKSIVDRQQAEGWGASVIDRLAADIQSAFPGIQGFSPSNISRMRAFCLAWRDQIVISAQPVPKMRRSNSAQAVPETEGPIWPPLVAEIPWGHHVVLLFKIQNPKERLWYAQQTLEYGWSRAVLVHQIESGLYHRQGKAVTNFERTLPPPQSDLAQQAIKDPYVFDFLTLAEDAGERELHRGLVDHIRKFLLELGVGFAYLGSQVRLAVIDKMFQQNSLIFMELCRG